MAITNKHALDRPVLGSFGESLGVTYRSLLLNVLAILGFALFITILHVSSGNNDKSLLGFFIQTFLIQIILPCYLHFALWRYTISKPRYLLYAIGLALIVLGLPYLTTATTMSVLVNQGGTYSQMVINTAFAIIFATGMRALYRSFKRQRELQELRAENVAAQLDGLRAQINPHFLFNTLNNIYGVNIDDSERGSEMILELAEVMRYHFDVSRQDQIPVSKEIQLIEAIVQLEQLRLRDNTDIAIDLPKEEKIKNLSIAPLLLVPLVENAFKHGAHPSKESFIELSLKQADNQLTFTVRNSYHPERKTISTGVGLVNVRKRLELIYGNQFKLTSGATDHVWEVILSIALSPAVHQPTR